MTAHLNQLASFEKMRCPPSFLRRAVSLALFLNLLAMLPTTALAQSQCQNNVCIKWEKGNDPKIARFQITGTYLSSAVFNLRQGSSQHEVRPGSIVSVPRSQSFVLQQCTKCALCVSSKCNPWGTYTPPKFTVDQWNRRVKLVNGATQPFDKLYATSSDTKKWGANRLSKRLLPSQSQTYDFTDGSGDCKFDFKAVLMSGQSVEKHNVDVCTVKSVIMR